MTRVLPRLAAASGVAALLTASPKERRQADPALFSVTGRDFLAHPDLQDEVFGPASLLIECESAQQLRQVLESLEGQLTATILATDADAGLIRPLLPLLERTVGRIVYNGYPTGVEVSYAMVHGGPFPATSDSRTTSVGAGAIDRFLRPVSYQNLPESLLPPSLLQSNPLNLLRIVDGVSEQPALPPPQSS